MTASGSERSGVAQDRSVWNVHQKDFGSHMQADCPSSYQFLTVGDEGLKAFNMSVLGDTSDYQWKEFQGSVQSAKSFETFWKC